MKKVNRTVPSATSLAEMPEMDFSKARVRRNPYAARIAKEGVEIRITRGRPRKGATAPGVVTKSVKQTVAFWSSLGAAAEKEGISLHEAMRLALDSWLRQHTPTPRRARKRAA
jgi:hypothetical protein